MRVYGMHNCMVMRVYRHALVFASGCALLLAALSCGCHNTGRDSGYGELVERLGEITEGKPGSFGVAVITDDADTIVFNNSSCYPMMSMFKLPEAIAVCHVLDMRQQDLDSALTVRRSDLDEHTWSPMLKDYAGEEFTVTVGRLLDYILIGSDNNASNILFDRIVSTAETDSYMRTILPESDFRIVHKESEMKADIMKSYDNCTSPLSYACLVDRLFKENIVSDVKQKEIIRAMTVCNTGMDRIAAGLPESGGVVFAHRTGSGYTNSRGEVIAVNDGGYVRLPSGKGYSIAVLVKDFGGMQEDAEKIIAEISGAVYESIIKR